MKKIILGLISVSLLLFSCDNNEIISVEDPYKIDLSEVQSTGLETQFIVTLQTVDGKSISRVNELSQGGTYQLTIESSAPVFHRIGLKGNFKIVKSLNDSSKPGTSRYIIKIVDEIANGVPLSVIVIRKMDNILFKETPKRLILLG